ncbi:MAG: ABC transporter permease [Candidatus Kariarchaeaceae archaeon]|jgi:ABC-type dipeptide/oligopeptide/nickel transport system permease subunit
MATKETTQNDTFDIIASMELRKGTTLDLSLKSDSWFKTVWARLSYNRPAMYSLYYATFMTALMIFYPILLPADPFTTDAIFTVELGGGSKIMPNFRHPIGTDFIGKDIISQLLAGVRTSMLVGIGSTIIFLLIGVPMGVISSYYGGKVEEILMRFTDFVIALPFLIITILAVQFFDASNLPLIGGASTPIIILVILGTFGWGGTARLTNATTKQVMNLEYVSAARTLGASDRRIIWKHIFPNILAPIIVIGTLGVGFGILSEAGITFLGFGDSSKDISWGTIIFWGQSFVSLRPFLVLAPGFAVFFVTISINLFGDAIRDALDPRLRR